MKRSLLCAAGIVIATLGGYAESLHAQGSAVQTHSSCATAMGAAGVASPCSDGSAVLFNPAALALQRSVVGLGWTGITTSGAFEYDPVHGQAGFERDNETNSVPFAFVNYRISDRLAAGLGVFAPYGLGIEWSETGDIPFEGRFVSYDTKLSNIYIQPTLSYAVSPRLSFGAGLDYIRSDLEINQRVDLATTATPGGGPTFGQLGFPLGTDFADVKLSGDGSAVTFHVGALARLTDMLSVGVRYLHKADIDYDGDADFTQVPTGITLRPANPLGLPAGTDLDVVLGQQFASGGQLADQAVSTSLAVPAQFVVGIALTPLPNLKLLADYQWTGWEEWDAADIEFANQDDPTVLVLDYQNTSTYRLGGEFGAYEGLTLRAGFIYNTAAQREFSVSPLLPEAERNYFSFGVGYAFSDNLRADAGYQHILQSDRRGRVRPRPDTLTDEDALRALNVGVFSSDAHLVNVTLSYQFGRSR